VRYVVLRKWLQVLYYLLSLSWEYGENVMEEHSHESRMTTAEIKVMGKL
jgi:hypothetical protein